MGRSLPSWNWRPFVAVPCPSLRLMAGARRSVCGITHKQLSLAAEAALGPDTASLPLWNVTRCRNDTARDLCYHLRLCSGALLWRDSRSFNIVLHTQADLGIGDPRRMFIVNSVRGPRGGFLSLQIKDETCQCVRWHTFAMWSMLITLGC